MTEHLRNYCEAVALAHNIPMERLLRLAPSELVFLYPDTSLTTTSKRETVEAAAWRVIADENKDYPDLVSSEQYYPIKYYSDVQKSLQDRHPISPMKAVVTTLTVVSNMFRPDQDRTMAKVTFMASAAAYLVSEDYPDLEHGAGFEWNFSRTLARLNITDASAVTFEKQEA